MAPTYAIVHTVIGQVYARSPDGLRRLLGKAPGSTKGSRSSACPART